MVETVRAKAPTVFRVLDSEGRSIGQVVGPRCRPILGYGARTVLLVRGERGMDEPVKACA
ncbi:MAG TPA: hypothetical protein VFD73_14235 [Gemmatimonadales bacterium]|nr:hypothetical protein [Gemmatimonadales bacterium]